MTNPIIPSRHAPLHRCLLCLYLIFHLQKQRFLNLPSPILLLSILFIQNLLLLLSWMILPWSRILLQSISLLSKATSSPFKFNKIHYRQPNLCLLITPLMWVIALQILIWMNWIVLNRMLFNPSNPINNLFSIHSPSPLLFVRNSISDSQTQGSHLYGKIVEILNPSTTKSSTYAFQQPTNSIDFFIEENTSHKLYHIILKEDWYALFFLLIQ